MSSHSRTALTKAHRVVVKIGSRALATDAGLISGLAEQIARLSSSKRGFLLVSSGAIALGCARLGYRKRPKEMPKLQAAAAAGQSILMHRYEEAFARVGRTVAQVLLTHSDLADRERLNNAREAMAALMEAGAIPVINENDTVATDEIRFGDNDQLASMVVPLVGADLLLLLTDVEGVLDSSGVRIPVLTDAQGIGRLARAGESLGTGGMQSKLDAALKASRSGAFVVVGRAAHPDVIESILDGADVGTLVPPHGAALKARKHWIAYTLRPRGTILIDPGAARVLREGKSSLLPIGVLGIRGQFHAGDAVRLVGPDGIEVGRGLTRLSAMDVALCAGKKGHDLELLLGRIAADFVVVHKDDLVIHS